VIAGNELAQYVLRTIYQKDSVQGVNLESKFRERDALNTGQVKRVEFLQVLEESVRELERWQIQNFVEMLVPPSDNIVNYSDFMRILYKFGEPQL